MKYTYKDIKDKSKEGIEKEIQDGFIVIGTYFKTTLGVPVDILQDWTEVLIKNKAEQLLFYMNFRNKYPNLWN